MAGAFSRKTSGISCDLTAFRKIKELRANAVETPLGVTGLLGDFFFISWFTDIETLSFLNIYSVKSYNFRYFF